MAVACRSGTVCCVFWTGYLAITVSLPAQDVDSGAQRAVPAATTASASTVTAEPKREPRHTRPTNHPGTWRRLHVPDPVASRAARQALDAAHELLSQPACVEGLSTFRDQSGRSLNERLSDFSVDFQAYLEMVVFIDGSRETRCTMGAFAFTAPGSRVVRLCVEQVKWTWQQDRMQTIALFIHEMLHTLGQ